MFPQLASNGVGGNVEGCGGYHKLERIWNARFFSISSPLLSVVNMVEAGESNYRSLLKTRKLLKIRGAQHARNAGKAVRMYTACT